ncbi:GIY-YIG catalytic domain-containing endonuclease [Paramecium bursaria Chlorella virus KS1B]|uniref:GIY-YIG catalytic domain-containing endonuclease n=1 Tax=Paramecium bursaria Chlorella virus IL3A TaxID=46019 RepID=M1H599_PBCVI|nr:GIY-YIG catalytic domain-containing endonuclease [Paramecium bursaria Chlorella virus IL3A]AGE54572.1 GIY-YIG catalytic domain-containing endonuclease [Paramecium bursaria Chlorella virus KS1B]
MGFIYTLTSPSRKEYVGQTTRSIEQRLDEHQKEDSGCKAIAGAIKEYGWDNFIVDYYECPDDELNKHETWLIRLMGTLAPCGYNLREGGGSRGKFSEESKNKMSESHKLLVGDKNPFYNKHHTEESRKKMSDAQKGEKSHLYGKPRKEEVKSKISKSQMGVNNSFYGKKHTEVSIKKQSESRMGEKNPRAKCVYQFDMNGNFIQSFQTVTEAAKYLGKTHSSIAECARGDRNSAYGFRWSSKPTLD